MPCFLAKCYSFLKVHDEVIDDKGILFTRTKEYVKSNETVESTPKLNKKSSGARNENFF